MKPDPPALTRSALTELIALGRQIAARMNLRERQNLEDALQLGQVLLKLKEDASHGSFEQALEKIHVSSQRASEYMRLAKSPVPGICETTSINAALEKVREYEARQKEEAQPAPTPAQLRDQLKAKQKAAAEKARADSGEKDDFGTPIPKRCLDAWKDPGLREVREKLAIYDDMLRRDRLADVVIKREAAYPFIDPKKFTDGIGQAMNTLEECLAYLRDNMPAGVCPSCAGKGCSHCLMSGLVPRNVYEGLKNGKGSA